jgi:Flp pilus assembly pilin Flp
MNTVNSERGQGLVEYALIIVLLAIVSIVALNFLAGGITGALYNNVISSL